MEIDPSGMASRSFSRRSLLKNSAKLGAAAVAAPALAISAMETAAPMVEKAVAAAMDWYEEVGGI